MTDYELPVNEYHSVGPLTDIHGHGPVTIIGSHLFVCLDCGYTTHSVGMLYIADCGTDANPVAETWRERLADEGFPEEIQPQDE